MSPWMFDPRPTHVTHHTTTTSTATAITTTNSHTTSSSLYTASATPSPVPWDAWSHIGPYTIWLLFYVFGSCIILYFLLITRRIDCKGEVSAE